MKDLDPKDLPETYNPSSRNFTGIVSEAKQIFEWRYNLPSFFEEVTGHSPYPYQAKFLKKMQNLRNRYAVISAGRGTGKTECLAVLALWYVYVLPITTPGIPMKVVILAGSEKQARICYGYIMGFITKIPFLQNALAKDPTKEEIEFIDGSWIRPLTASEKSVRGPHPDLLIVDEACQADDNLLTAAMPMIGTSQFPRLILSSTPDKFFSLFVHIFSKDKDFPQFLRFNWCLDEESEILTKDGWKGIDSLTLDDEIATLKKENHSLEYQKPHSIFKDNYTGKMIHFKGRKMNLLVTPNHKVYSKLYNRKKWSFREAKDFLNLKAPQARKMLHSFKWKGKDQPLIRIGSQLFDTKKFLRFFGWYLSEGSAGHYSSGHKISISNRDPEFQKEICQSIRELGFNCWLSSNKAVEFKSKDLVSYLLKLGNCKTRFIPREFLSLSVDYLESLFLSLMKGDGSLRSDKTFTNDRMIYYTCSERLANDVLELALKLGFSASISKGTSSRYEKEFGPRFIVYISKEKEVGTSIIKEINYSGRIWCPSTKNGIILVKRKGKIVWTGNSAEDCPIVSKTFLQNQKKLIDRGNYMIEYLGIPYSFAGKVFPLDKLKECVKHRGLIDTNGSKYAGVDWGHYPAPTVIVIVERLDDKQGNVKWKVLHAEPFLKQNFEHVLDKIELIARSYQVSSIYTDSNDIGENQRLSSRGLPVLPVKFKSQKAAMISNLRAIVENELIQIDGAKDYPLVAQMRDYRYDSKKGDDYVDALMLAVRGARSIMPLKWNIKDYVIIKRRQTQKGSPFDIKHQMDRRYIKPEEIISKKERDLWAKVRKKKEE